MINTQRKELILSNQTLLDLQNDLTKINAQMVENQQELVVQNEDLIRYQEKIEQLNQTLETKVSKRTSQLEDKNEKLKEYAFINAHMLRAPFCRIQGLVNLISINTTDQQELEQLITLLGYSIRELDEVIRAINDVLDDEKQLDQEKLYALYARDEIRRKVDAFNQGQASG